MTHSRIISFLKSSTMPFILLLTLPAVMNAQQVLSLEDCRDMAIQSNKDIESAKMKIKMAEYDKKIAAANWYPKIGATWTYMFNEKNLSLISDDMSFQLQNAGNTVEQMTQQLQKAIMSNPAALAEFMNSPLWKTILGQLSSSGMSNLINQFGTEIDQAFQLDIQNVVVGVVSLQQPVYMGGKIAAANKIAKLAIELSKSQYDQKYQEILVDVDQSYWQIVSIANKLKLAEEYASLLHKMENDVQISIEAGILTEADLLQIKVQVNEADMTRTKARNGLALSKMLLCKQVGLDLNSDIVLKDEYLEEIPVPALLEQKEMEQVFSDRPEIRSLDLASQIYDKKVAVVRADQIPSIAISANYLVSYPSAFNGFQTEWSGMFNAGVMLKIPIFHGMEAVNKTRKAKQEAQLYHLQLEDTKNLIQLQVTQLRMLQEETLEKLTMARSNSENAQENLRTATLGFEAGIIPTNTALAAHTAWLKAQSEYIDTGIELQIHHANLLKAEGSYSRHHQEPIQ